MIVEVHAGDNTDLWYHTGTVQGDGTVRWSPSRQYDRGSFPSVAMAGSMIVEVHQGDNGNLWYHTGTVQGDGTVLWSPSHQYDNGYAPSVAMAGSTIVETHEFTLPGKGNFTDLWYHSTTWA